MKTILIIFAAIATLIGVGFGYSSYEKFKTIEAIQPVLKNTTLRVANGIKQTIETDGGLTFKELFDRLETDIKAIDEHVMTLQTLSNEKNKRLTDPAVEYLKSGQAYLRAQTADLRKTLEFGIALDGVAERKKEISYSITLDEYNLKASAAERAKKDMLKAKKEKSKAQEEMAEAAKQLGKAADNLRAAQTFSHDSIIDAALVNALGEKLVNSD